MTGARQVQIAHTEAPEYAAQVVQLFATMMAVTPEQCPSVVRRLAADGNLAVLQTVLASGLIHRECKEAARLASAMGPLAGLGGQGPVSADLVSNWLEALDLDTPEKLGALLPQVAQITEIRDLLHVFGADPLAATAYTHELGLGTPTALGHAVLSGERMKAPEMLEVLVKQGRDPVAFRSGDETVSMFAAMAASELESPNNVQLRGVFCQILTILRNMDLPAAWEYQAGDGLLRYLNAKKPIGHRPDRAMVAMLGIARFDNPTNWLDIMRASDVPEATAQMFLDAGHQDLALRVIANMKRDRVDLDTLWCVGRSEDGGREKMPFLHAAVSHDRPEIVEALLDAGCNPGPAAHVIGAFAAANWQTLEREALAVAQPGSASEKMVLAWQAKQSIGGVLDKALAGRRQP